MKLDNRFFEAFIGIELLSSTSCSKVAVVRLTRAVGGSSTSNYDRLPDEDLSGTTYMRAET